MPLPLPGSRVAPGKLDRVAGVAAASDLARERRHRRPARTRPVDSGCSWQSSAAAVVQRAWPATANQAVFDWLLITAPMVVHAEADVFTPQERSATHCAPSRRPVPASAALPFPCFKLVLLKLPLTHWTLTIGLTKHSAVRSFSVMSGTPTTSHTPLAKAPSR